MKITPKSMEALESLPTDGTLGDRNLRADPLVELRRPRPRRKHILARLHITR